MKTKLVLSLNRRRKSLYEKSAARSSSIVLERFEAGRHAFIAACGDLQIGWCIKRDKKWHIQDMDCQDLAGPFPNLRTAARAGVKVLAEFAGS